MHLLRYLIWAIVTVSAPLAAVPFPPADRAAIQHVIDGQTAAWNRHDMHAFVADMTADADWINVVGMHWQGRETVEHAHAVLHRLPMFANSHMVPSEIDVRAIGSDVAIVVEKIALDHVGPTPGGGTYPSGGGLLTLVLVRTADGWRITHGHNTTIDARATRNDPAQPK